MGDSQIAQRNREDPPAFIANRAIFGNLVDDDRFVTAYRSALVSLKRAWCPRDARVRELRGLHADGVTTLTVPGSVRLAASASRTAAKG